MTTKSSESYANTSPRDAAFTLFELLLVVGIVAVLAALLLPAISRLRSQAVSGACVNNLRQIGAFTQVCIIDNRGYLPSSYHRFSTNGKGDRYWFQQIADAGGEEVRASLEQPGNLFMCPASNRRWAVEQRRFHGNYAWNISAGNEWREGETQPYLFRHRRDNLEASRVVLMADAANGAYAAEYATHWFSDRSYLDARHQGGTQVNVLFLDNSVRSIPFTQLTSAILTVKPR